MVGSIVPIADTLISHVSVQIEKPVARAPELGPRASFCPFKGTLLRSEE